MYANLLCIVVIVDALWQDDWDVAQVKIPRLQLQQKVIYYQLYAPNHEDPRKRLFVVVIQDDFLNRMAKRFSTNNTWAFDSTFKTNQYDLCLYANEDENGIPVFYMMCFVNKNNTMKGFVSNWHWLMLLNPLLQFGQQRL